METDSYSRTIAELDNDDKPREKALKHGVEHLTNTELLAIILGSGLRGKSVLDLSAEILKGYDNRLATLSRTSVFELMTKFKGVGEAKAISVIAAIEFGGRCIHALQNGEMQPTIKSSRDIHNYMVGLLQLKPHEEFWVVFLNNSNRVMSAECVSKGGLASTIVDVKLILKRALDKLATSIILVHNHPSGNLKPSIPDDRITTKVKDAAKLIDLNVLDHVIVTPAGYYSYADEGRL